MSISTTGPRHPSLIAQVNTRRDELQLALTQIGKDDATTRAAIETALGSLVPMLTGDLEHVPDMVSRDLTRWLELNRHLGVSQETPVVIPETPVVIPEAPVVVPEKPVITVIDAPVAAK